MKSLRFMLCILLLSAVTAAFAQSGAAPQSDAQKSFALLKTLAGSWEGTPTMVPAQTGHSDMPGLMQVSLRVTSNGNAIMHEMKGKDQPGVKSKDNDDPITMFYVNGDQLLLTHYCDAGNRPRMTGKLSPDGKTVEFDFLDISGSTQHGHMAHAVFTIIDANHHTEDWTYLLPGNKSMHGHIDLRRVQ